ncbi:MAG: trypsin-like peptidase domain-containing protein, partial [Methylocella sp.]
VAVVHDWAVARLTHPIEGVTPYGLATAAGPNMPIEFVARGHIDWGGGRRLSIEKCHLHDQLSAGAEGTREFSFDCDTGDGASGGALVTATNKPAIRAILVGWRSNKPFRAAPFSRFNYNFAVTMEGAFKRAVVAAASKVVVAK